MHAPSFHNAGLPSFRQPRWYPHLRAMLHDWPLYAGRAWEGAKLFSGVGAFALVAYVALDIGGSSFASRPVPRQAIAGEHLSVPNYNDQVVYFVSSQRAAENLMAYGLPTDNPQRLLPQAHVTVFVADTPENELQGQAFVDQLLEARRRSPQFDLRVFDLR